MQPTAADLVAQIGEQAVEIRLLRRQLEAAQKALAAAQAQSKLVAAALAAKDQARAETDPCEPEPENSP
jgi:hypothetical protein